MVAETASPASTPSVLQGGYIPGLDGLRAISVCLVMVAHYGFGTLVPGGLGVTIFFFISGFLITTLLVQERRKHGRIDIFRFYARRFCRLGPELFVCLALTSALGLIYDALPNGWDIGAALLYFTNYYHLFAEHAGIDLRWPHLWSLAVEEHYYLTYPALLLLLAHRPKRLLVVLVGICCAALAWRIASFAQGFSFTYIGQASEARIDSIAYGCITALLLTSSRQNIVSERTAACAGLIGCALLLFSLSLRGDLFRETVRYSIQGLGLVALFFGLFLSKAWTRAVRILEVAPMRWMGRMSYAAYLWHFEAVIIYGHVTASSMDKAPLGTKILCTVVAIAIAFGIAYLSYLFVFKPTQPLRHRFSSDSASHGAQAASLVQPRGAA